jgi:hypothetical protein
MAYSPTNWVEGVTTLGPTNMNKIETELVYLDTRVPPAALGYGTTLPGSPVDGQEYVYVDSTTAPTYQWRLRYNAGSSSTYKWEYVGGSPMTVGPTGTATYNSTGWTTLGGLPNLTVPRAGDYLVEFGCWAQANAAPAPYSIDVRTFTGATFGQIVDLTAVATYHAGELSSFDRYNGVAASSQFQFQGNLGTGNSTSLARGRLKITPVRLS